VTAISSSAIVDKCVISDKHKQPGADRQVRSQRRRMSLCPSVSGRYTAPRQRLVRKAETEKDNPQMSQCHDLRVGSGLTDERVM
jgi:hypothetical protein